MKQSVLAKAVPAVAAADRYLTTTTASFPFYYYLGPTMIVSVHSSMWDYLGLEHIDDEDGG